MTKHAISEIRIWRGSLPHVRVYAVCEIGRKYLRDLTRVIHDDQVMSRGVRRLVARKDRRRARVDLNHASFVPGTNEPEHRVLWAAAQNPINIRGHEISQCRASVLGGFNVLKAQTRERHPQGASGFCIQGTRVHECLRESISDCANRAAYFHGRICSPHAGSFHHGHEFGTAPDERDKHGC
jgi:hypothetical protein